MRPRPGRTSPGTCQGFMGCRPVGRERQDAGHTARSCFVWPRHRQRVTYLLAYGWAYCERAEGRSVFQANQDGNRSCKTFTKVGLDALLTPENCAVLLIDHRPSQLANVNSHEPTLR